MGSLSGEERLRDQGKGGIRCRAPGNVRRRGQDTVGPGAGPKRTGRPSCQPWAPGTEEERQDLSTALGLVKELLSNVDQDVHELEKGARLQEIYHRMDPRAQTPVPGKGPFGREELLRRRLIHDGCLLWKTATGRFKGQWSARQIGRASCRERVCLYV